MIELRLLGQFSVRRSGTEVNGVLAQRKRFAALVYLLLGSEQRFHERDALLALLWPESNDRLGRLALRKTLHFLRAELGAQTIENRGRSQVGVGEGAVWCDALALRQALRAGDHRLVLQVYQGTLLPGFHLTGASEFEEWLEAERARLQQWAYASAMALASEELERNEPKAALQWAEQAERIAPDFGEAGHLTVALLHETGNSAAALGKYRAIARRLRKDYGLSPNADLLGVVSAVQAGEPAPRPRISVRSPSEGSGTSFHEEVLDSLPDPVYALDPDGRIQYVNQATTRITGYRRQELLGRSFTELVVRQYRSAMESLQRDQMRERVPTTYREFPLMTKAGEELWLAQHLRLVHDAGGGVAGVRAVARDITDSRKPAFSVSEPRDPVTGLPDGAAVQRVVQSRREGRDSVLVRVRVDACGSVHDDALPVQVTSLLREVLRTSDVVARVSEREFVIVSEDLTLAAAELICDRIEVRHQALMAAGALSCGLRARVGCAKVAGVHAGP